MVIVSGSVLELEGVFWCGGGGDESLGGVLMSVGK